MSKNYFSKTMRCLRLARSKLEDAHRVYMGEINDAESLLKRDEITKTVYDRRTSAARNAHNETHREIVEKATEEISGYLGDMRELAKQYTVKPPTPEMVSTLQILSMLDRVTPVQITLYAEQLADCPLAMSALQQIAAKHNQRIIIDDADSRLQQLDMFASYITGFLQGFSGEDETSPATVRQLLPYLQSEAQLMSVGGTENANRSFWARFISQGDPAFYDQDGTTAGKPKVQYFFNNVDELLGFIKQETAGKEEGERPGIINDILNNCPDRYGAAYRAYMACGEKDAINE